ncbi:MAG TPA: hypothetical protein VFE90_03225 [Myxococcales bacterium]|nr:hypothetical protein [Myxococcales bacterium]
MLRPHLSDHVTSSTVATVSDAKGGGKTLAVAPAAAVDVSDGKGCTAS